MGSYEHVKFWHDTTLSDLELLHASYVTHTFAPHTHDGYVVGIIERGAERFKYRGSSHIAPAGSIILINPGEMHTGASAAEHGWTYRALYPSTELMQRAVSDIVGRQRDIPFFTEPVIYDLEIAEQIAFVHRALEEQTSILERESRLLWALAHLMLRYADDRPRIGTSAKEHKGIHRVRSYLDEHYAENVSLESLAALADLSPFHLLRTFRDQLNLPPHTYQIQTRIIHAKRLLRMGVSCVDTALTVGFADQSHFTKHFKRIVGVTPGLYSGARKK